LSLHWRAVGSSVEGSLIPRYLARKLFCVDDAFVVDCFKKSSGGAPKDS